MVTLRSPVPDIFARMRADPVELPDFESSRTPAAADLVHHAAEVALPRATRP
jgi:hypothetical protein